MRHSPTRRRRYAGASLACVLLLVPALPVASRTQEAGEREGSLLLVPGVATSSGRGALFRLDPASLGFACRQVHYFSYAGPGRGAPRRQARCPIRSGAPYRRSHAQRPLAESARVFRRQAAVLEHPIIVVTHSQGAWVASAALSRYGHLGVRHLIMLGPYPTHPVAYRDVGSGGLRLLLWSLRRAGRAGGFDASAPLARELLATPGALGRVMRTPLPRPVRALNVTSLYDLPTMPAGWRSDVAADTCPVPVPHSSLPTSHRVSRVVNGFLDGEELGSCPWWRTAVRPITRPFGVP